MNDPWTWTAGWELTVAVGLGWAEEGGGGGRNCNRITIQKDEKKDYPIPCASATIGGTVPLSL